MTETTKAVIVTGGGSGIGAATAARLVRDGWDVTIAGRTLEKLEKTAISIGAPNEMGVVQADVSDRDAFSGSLLSIWIVSVALTGW